MPVTIGSLGTTPYLVGASQIIPAVPIIRNEHMPYTTNGARVNITETVDGTNSKIRHIAGAANVGGSVIYLPYRDDHITSVRLPVPPPGAVNFFYTANMSGCKFFVDTITGSHDLMVYHANTHQHGAPPHSPFNSQAPAAAAILDTMHTNAQLDYANLPAPNNLALHNVAMLAKPQYFLEGRNAELRKFNQGRTLQQTGGAPALPPEFVGGCTVVGLFAGGGWHFYYQTWGDVEYHRPTGAATVAKALVTFHWKYIHKRIWQDVHHDPLPAMSLKVVDHGLVY
jgi:hypothetical protein